jgi:hypothetical protein
MITYINKRHDYEAQAAALGNEVMMSDGGGGDIGDNIGYCKLAPSRAQNPMVRDAEFTDAAMRSSSSSSSSCRRLLRQREYHHHNVEPLLGAQAETMNYRVVPPAASSGLPSSRANVPLIRIEGFEHRRSSSAAHEPCHRVPAFA